MTLRFIICISLILISTVSISQNMNNKVTVPPGHNIIVVHPSDQDKSFSTKSGLIIIDLGQNGASNDTYKKLDQLFNNTKTSIMWIIQDKLIDKLKKSDTLKTFLQDISNRKSKYDTSQYAVFPLNASSHTDVMKEFKAMGFGVHYSAEDGACFVEVHKPDGQIQIGMPGASFSQ